MKEIPAFLYAMILNYFGSDQWFFIKHPTLFYQSPWAYLMASPNNLGKVIAIARIDTRSNENTENLNR